MPKETRRTAVGIPDRSIYGDPSKIRPGSMLDLIVQYHEAEKAGPHYDIRIGSPELDLLSWASRKEMPSEPGIKRLLIEQPLHEFEYGEFEGEIPSGYGKGKVKLVGRTKILVTDVGDNYIKFTLADTRYPERFMLIRMKNQPKKWLMMNITPVKYPEEYEKPRFKTIDAEEVEEYIKKMKEGDTLQEKIDGAHGIVQLLKDSIEVLSVRKSVTGKPIVHTERIFAKIPKANIPKQLQNSLLAGEIFGQTEKGNVIPPQDLGAILNSVILKSLEKQEEEGVDLRVALFDIIRAGSKELSKTPYLERYKFIEEKILPLLPDKFEMIKQVETQEEAKKFWDKIRSGKYPRTSEGVVIRLQEESKPIKAKTFNEIDVYIRDIFPGEGKYSGVGAGGFYYSLEPDGKIVGKVGTGFSDELRKYMWEHPEEFIGRVARVKYQEKFPSGALRAPVFLALHEGK